MIDRLGVHGTNHRDVVRNGFHAATARHLNARLAAPLELEFTATGNRFWPLVIVVIRWPLRMESGRS